VNEETILAFVRATIHSAWSLEVLLLLARASAAFWTVDAIVRELRGSLPLVHESLINLRAVGLLETASETVRYKPESPLHADLVDGLLELYARKPITVRRAIFTARDRCTSG